MAQFLLVKFVNFLRIRAFTLSRNGLSPELNFRKIIPIDKEFYIFAAINN